MRNKILGLVLTILLVSAAFSYYRLGSSVLNVDGQLWHQRSSNFITAILKRKFEKTYQDSKPGVTVMWLSGISSEIFLRIYESKFGFRPEFYVKDKFPLIFSSFVAPLVLVNLLTGFLFFFLVKKLSNTKVALFSYVLFAFHPYYLGISRFLHVDSLMTNFMTLSYLFFLIFIKNNKKTLYILLSGIFLGLAVLTKSQALFLLPIMFVSIVIEFLTSKENLSFYSLYKKIILPLSIIFITVVIVYFILFPAMWSNPISVVRDVLGEAVYVAEVGRSTKNIKPLYHYVFLLPNLISYPIILIYFCNLVFMFFKRKLVNKELLRTYIQLSLFVLIYFLEISLVKQKIDRYLLPLFPFIFISCAVFLSYLKNYKIIFITLSITLILTLFYYAPHYAMFGCNSYECNTHGFLYKEVGDYIDSNTTQEFPTVVAVTKPYALKVFVNGNTFGHEELIPENINIDFLVTNDFFIEDRGIPQKLQHCIYWHRINYHNTPAWDIYKCR